MTTLYFECKFLSDVILNATSATAGATETLEYIPGAKFLGVVAKFYEEIQKKGDAITVFHSGKVRFGDAHLSKDGKRGIKIPFDFFAAKNSEDGVAFINHLHENLGKEKGIQPKQQRKGYFIKKDEKNIKLESKSSYSLKSAYDAEKRKSKDQQIFGYQAIKKGSVWMFSVEIDEEATNYSNKIKEILSGEQGLGKEHGLGKSRSAQYGRVCIKLLDKIDSSFITIPQSNNSLVLYAESNWCFLDENGQPTVQPRIKDLELNTGEIDWSKSQIRHRVYAPWNVKRAARDADRWVIEKGSVLVIKNAGEVQQSQFEKGIGLFRAEGFGKVLINPDFLSSTDFHFESKSEKEKREAEEKEQQKAAKTAKEITLVGKNNLIAQLLKQRQEKADPQTNISKKVGIFIKENKAKFEKITPSQWGQVRSIAQNVRDEKQLKTLLFNEDVGFLFTAKRKDYWKKDMIKVLEDCANLTQDFKEKQGFLMALASEMAKMAQAQKSK